VAPAAVGIGVGFCACDIHARHGITSFAICFRLSLCPLKKIHDKPTNIAREKAWRLEHWLPAELPELTNIEVTP